MSAVLTLPPHVSLQLGIHFSCACVPCFIPFELLIVDSGAPCSDVLSSHAVFLASSLLHADASCPCPFLLETLLSISLSYLLLHIFCLSSIIFVLLAHSKPGKSVARSINSRVVPRLQQMAAPEMREVLLRKIKEQLEAMRKQAFAKHVVVRVEKLLTAAHTYVTKVGRIAIRTL
jgi:hypothetical protein